MLASEEQRLLALSEAEALLHSLGRTLTRCVSVASGARRSVWRYCEDDAVLFIGAFGRPWTAWIDRDGGQSSVRYEQGWSASLGSCSRVSTPTPAPACRFADPPEYEPYDCAD